MPPETIQRITTIVNFLMLHCDHKVLIKVMLVILISFFIQITNPFIVRNLKDCITNCSYSL